MILNIYQCHLSQPAHVQHHNAYSQRLNLGNLTYRYLPFDTQVIISEWEAIYSILKISFLNFAKIKRVVVDMLTSVSSLQVFLSCLNVRYSYIIFAKICCRWANKYNLFKIIKNSENNDVPENYFIVLHIVSDIHIHENIEEEIFNWNYLISTDLPKTFIIL